MITFVSEKKAAEILGVSVATLRRDRYSGRPRWPFVKVGDPGSKGAVLYDQAEMERIAREARSAEADIGWPVIGS